MLMCLTLWCFVDRCELCLSASLSSDETAVQCRSALLGASLHSRGVCVFVCVCARAEIACRVGFKDRVCILCPLVPYSTVGLHWDAMLDDTAQQRANRPALTFFLHFAKGRIDASLKARKADKTVPATDMTFRY